MEIKRLNNGGTVKLDLDKLNAIQKALGSGFITQVGVLGQKTNRTLAIEGTRKPGKQASEQSNADIGMRHEFGVKSEGLPRRSFLLMPLQQNAVELMKTRKILWDTFLAGKQTVASLKLAYTQLGIFAENIVQKAFETGGFGKWLPDAPSTIRRKGSSAILIDTGQLRRSITSRVVKR